MEQVSRANFGVSIGVGAGHVQGWGQVDLALACLGVWRLRTGGASLQRPPYFPRTSSKPSSTHRAPRWRYRTTGRSQPSFSSSSRSGPCPIRPQAWAKHTQWAPWVRSHAPSAPWGGDTESPGDKRSSRATTRKGANITCRGTGLSFTGNQTLLTRLYLLRHWGRKPKERTACSPHHRSFPDKLGGGGGG